MNGFDYIDNPHTMNSMIPSMSTQWYQEDGSQQAFGLWSETPKVEYGPTLPPPKPKGKMVQAVRQPQTCLHNKFGALGSIEEDADEEEMPDEIDGKRVTIGSTRLPRSEKKMPIMPKNASKQSSKKKDKKQKRQEINDKIEQDIDDILDKLDAEFEEMETTMATTIGVGSEVSFFDDEIEEASDNINAFPEESSGSEWQKVTGVMDSGAADHVGNRRMSPNIPIVPSVGSKKGQCFISATGGRAPNEGEQRIEAMTEEGWNTDMNIQMTDGVQRPLFAVSKVCDRGNRVIFGRGGGVIHNLASNNLTSFRRVGGIYSLDLWMRPRQNQADRSGFQRRGA
jgi:hypothetical protein